ncbi:MAG TPA: GAF and ANTAR domain-containing protein [Nocardioidaceae bacterium]|nr:GAF and ANTAR domain-containing protein [Nocardioidaceae bacterium]
MDDASAEEFARIALELHDQPGLIETVDQVAQFALSAVSCEYADVLFVHRRERIESMASTGDAAEKAGELQITHREGPALAMTASDENFIAIRDTREDERWPNWCADVAKLGIRSVLTVRLATLKNTIGVINAYGEYPECFDADDLAVVHVLAQHAAVALATARNESTLWQAIDARKTIGQAQGILMERFDLTPDQAFGVLRRYSQAHNIKLSAVAGLLISTRKLPGEPK